MVLGADLHYENMSILRYNVIEKLNSDIIKIKVSKIDKIKIIIIKNWKNKKCLRT